MRKRLGAVPKPPVAWTPSRFSLHGNLGTSRKAAESSGYVLLGLIRNRNSWNDQNNSSFSGLSWLQTCQNQSTVSLWRFYSHSVMSGCKIVSFYSNIPIPEWAQKNVPWVCLVHWFTALQLEQKCCSHFFMLSYWFAYNFVLFWLLPFFFTSIKTLLEAQSRSAAAALNVILYDVKVTVRKRTHINWNNNDCKDNWSDEGKDPRATGTRYQQ